MNYLTPDITGPQRAVALEGDRINRFNRQFALYAPDGTPLPYSDIQSAELTTHVDPQVELPTDAQVIEGPVLFCGLVLEQFGHVLTNSLGRLWALRHLPAETKLLFVPKRRSPLRFYPFLPMILKTLGIPNEVIISRGPLVLETCFTASDLYGERYGGLGSAEFLNWFDAQLPPAPAIDSGSKLYVSRSSLGPAVGRFACEDHLESLLVAQGYEMYAPEGNDLAAQIERLRRAENLIFAEGSAQHLFAMVRRPEQRVAVIQRRSALPPLIERHMDLRPGSAVALIDVVREELWPPVRADNRGIALLDFLALRLNLIGAGLLDYDAEWSAPTRAAEEASLRAGLADSEPLMTLPERSAFLKSARKSQPN